MTDSTLELLKELSKKYEDNENLEDEYGRTTNIRVHEKVDKSLEKVHISPIRKKTKIGGVSLEPVNEENVQEHLNEKRKWILDNIDPNVMNKEEIEARWEEHQNSLENFGIDDNPFAVPDPTIKIDPSQIDSTKEQPLVNESVEINNQEERRIEAVLKEKFGENYVVPFGKNIGYLSFKEKDGLARRRRFEDRQLYFLSLYPEGRYFRHPVGGGKYEEMYSFSKNGDVHRNKTFQSGKDVSVKEMLGNVSGSVARFSTVGAVLGSFSNWPFAGTAAGSFIGDLVDQMIVDEHGGKIEDYVKRLSVRDAATIAIVDGALTKILMSPPKKLKALMEGDPFFDTAKAKLIQARGLKSAEAQEAIAKELNLDLTTKMFIEKGQMPALGAIQLSDSAFGKLAEKIAKQVSGTSPRLDIRIRNQERFIFEHLNKKANSNGLEALTTNELRLLQAIRQKDIAQQIGNLLGKKLAQGGDPKYWPSFDSTKFKGAKGTETGLLNTTQAISKDIDRMKDMLKVLTKRKYKQAFGAAENVTFDLSALKKSLDDIEFGTPIFKVGKRDTRRVGGLNQEFKDLIEELRSYRTDIDTIHMANPKLPKGQQTEKMYSSLEQLKAIKDRIQIAMSKDGFTDGATAEKLINAIDTVFKSGKSKGLNKEWEKFWKEAQDLSKLGNDLTSYSKLSGAFGRAGENNTLAFAEKFWTGAFNVEDWNNLQKLIMTSRSQGPDGKIAGDNVLGNIRNGFLDWLKYDPTKIAQKLDDFPPESELFQKLVPDAKTRTEIIKLRDEMGWANNSSIKSALAKDRTTQDNAFAIVENLTNKELHKMMLDAAKKEGVSDILDTKFAEGLRASLLRKVLGRADTRVNDEVGRGLNLKILTDDLEKLANFTSTEGLDFSQFRPLFQRFNPDKEIYLPIEGVGKRYLESVSNWANYAKGASHVDPSGDLQSQAIVAGLTSAKGEALRKWIQNDYLAAFLSRRISANKIHEVVGTLDRTGTKLIKPKNNYRMLQLTSYLMTNLFKQHNLDIPGANRGYGYYETPSQESRRTNRAPQLSFQSKDNTDKPVNTSNLTTDDKPPINVSSLLPPVNQRNTQANSAKFASLFPRDNLGQAIADRSGIMGAIG